MKYLWELKIEDIPLGWQGEYDKGLKQYPNGMPLLIKGNKFLVHPVKYRDLLVQTFNTYKEKALMLNNIYMKDSKEISELLESDIILFNVLFQWLLSEDIVEPTFYDINKIKNNKTFIDTEIYFLEEDAPYEPISHYYSYKFLRLNGLNKH